MLKTINYKTKLGNVLPEAYCLIDEITKYKKSNTIVVKFVVQSSRENALTLDPFEEHTVNFVWDRKTDIATMAYNTLKAPIKKVKWNKELNTTEEIEEVSPFAFWQDIRL